MTLPFHHMTRPLAPAPPPSVVRPGLPPRVPYRQYQPWKNWGETASCTPEFTLYPQGVEDLRQTMQFARATGRKLRVVASGHSWSALVPTDDILVSMRRFNQVTLDLSDASQPKVVIESGATVEEVNAVLEAAGYSLPLNVVLESVRFCGLIATASQSHSASHAPFSGRDTAFVYSCHVSLEPPLLPGSLRAVAHVDHLRDACAAPSCLMKGNR